MNNELQIFDNDKLKIKVRAIKNDDGSISVSAEDVAIGYGWLENKGNKIYAKWKRLNENIEELTGENSPQVGKGDFIPESLFYLLGMKANNDKAREFQKWLAIDVIPSVRITGSYSIKNEDKSVVPIETIDNLVGEIKGTIHNLNEYYKPTHRRKLDVNKMIQNTLGVNNTKDNAKRVKEILLGRLGVDKYEELGKDILESSSTLNMVYEICVEVNRSEGNVQESFF